MRIAPLTGVLLLLSAGCPGDPSVLPKRLWLDTGLTEANVLLVDHEPPPF